MYRARKATPANWDFFKVPSKTSSALTGTVDSKVSFGNGTEQLTQRSVLEVELTQRSVLGVELTLRSVLEVELTQRSHLLLELTLKVSFGTELIIKCTASRLILYSHVQ